MNHVTSEQLWPPPEDWTEVIILWVDVYTGPRYPIREILDWVYYTEGGNYHLSGLDQNEGFSFRFEDAWDAMFFRLRWL